MSFAAPLAFVLAVLAAPIAILYILKVKRRRVSIPYLRLWEELLVETRARSLFKRLKRLLSLLLQLLILCALVLALARPAFELASVKKESIVLLLDTSASMQAVEDRAAGTTRFERMLERASEYVEDRSFEDELMIVAVSDRVDVLCPFSRNTLLLREALARVAQTNGSIDCAKAYAFAREVSADREHPVILFLSDGAAGEVRRLVDGDESAALVPIGEATENVGIVRFAARKNTSLGTDYLLGVIKNFGTQPATFNYEITINDATQKVVPVTLEPGEELTIQKQYALGEGATLQLSLDGSDALSIDDRAWAVVRPTRLRKVVLVAPDEDVAQPFLIAMRAMGEVLSQESFAVTPAGYAELSEDERLCDITLCVGALPEALPTGGNLVLMGTPVPEFVPARIVGQEADPVVWDWEREHVLNRYLNWRDLSIPPAQIVRIQGEAGLALLSSYEGPLISAFDLGERMVVYVGFDMSARLFPLRLAFPMLLRNALAWFEIEEDLVFEPSYAVGDTIQPLRRVPDREVSVTFFREGEPVQRVLTTRDGRFLFDETEEPGGYLFRAMGTNHPVAVNLFDPAESHIAPDEPSADAEAAIERGRHFLNRDLWTLFTLAALLAWALEWAFYHRRITE